MSPATSDSASFSSIFTFSGAAASVVVVSVVVASCLLLLWPQDVKRRAERVRVNNSFLFIIG